MTHNPECGLDCVSAGAVRLDNTPSADQQTGRQYLSGDQSAEQAMLAALKELRVCLLADHGAKGGLLAHTRQRACDIVREAIAKAEGRDR